MSVLETVAWNFYDYNQNLWRDGTPSVQAVWADAERWLTARVADPEISLLCMRHDPLTLPVTLLVQCSPETADWLYDNGQA
jgi:hypothetical protein